MRALPVIAALIILAAAVAAGIMVGLVLAPSPQSAVTLDMPAAGSWVADEGPQTHIFDSISADDAQPLDQWRRDTAKGGAFSHLSIAGPRPLPLDARPLRDDDVLVAVGWVGDALLGVPFRHVVFSLCGSVVGAVEAGEVRPDVTHHIHPNLTAPGWTARLATAHLPRCAAPVLRAWAAHSGGILYPLEGNRPLDFAAGDAPADGDRSKPVGRSPLTPDSLPPLDRRTIEISSPRGALLRRCGDAECEAVGGISQGAHAAMILDDTDAGWVLLVADGQAGWLSRSLFTEAEPR